MNSVRRFFLIVAPVFDEISTLQNLNMMTLKCEAIEGGALDISYTSCS